MEVTDSSFLAAAKMLKEQGIISVEQYGAVLRRAQAIAVARRYVRDITAYV